MTGVRLAVTSGFLAATGSMLGKYAMSGDHFMSMVRSVESLVQSLFRPDQINWITIMVTFIESYSMAFRVFLFVTMVTVNTLMWTTFAKALNVCPSAVIATAINTSCNFVFTAIYGKLLFDEVLTLSWFFGCTLMIIGVVLIKDDDENADKKVN